MLERTVVLEGVCRMTPMPSLLADPSQPMAMYDCFSGVKGDGMPMVGEGV